MTQSPPTPGPACVEIEAALDALAIIFPGGATLQAAQVTDIPNLSDLCFGLLAQANVALMPLVPIFDVIQVLVDIVNVIKALAPVPDPLKLPGLIEKLAADVDKLLSVLPQFSIPLMIKSFLNVIVNVLIAIKGELSVMLAFSLQVGVSTARVSALEALPNGAGTFAATQLQIGIDCANANLTVYQAGLGQRMGPLKQLLCLLNELTGLVPGLPKIPCDFTASIQASVSLEVTVEIVADVIIVFQDLMLLIPVELPGTDCTC